MAQSTRGSWRRSGTRRRRGPISRRRRRTISSNSVFVGDIHLRGDIAGGGTYEELVAHTIAPTIFGRTIRILDLPWLIRVKRAAGRPKDLEVIAELEALREEIEQRERSEGAT